ncbi:phosphoadenylyl-sulfate reductase [Paraferrimonas sedimenticola]|uniref:Phosphoadenosine 5'-phosphosulfate reductase n=1 Tax=Paraferrimonas sedimenticola TaxID=375674 RepID=A0AA37RUQ5_9GAMM|nr:phosphoadenylyl-sulfate reductase [Paraferrimonas sedimenticola]GLP95659.1 phosphoadenosine phosphosulfate reductase [Paraferrimonas sedimenticola]
MASLPSLAELNELSAQQQVEALAPANQLLEAMTPAERLAWAAEHLPGPMVLSSSFGVQAAVMLHLSVQQQADMPVILTDTGYLFPETYRFIDELTEQLQLNLQVYRAERSPAWQEASYGQLWLQGEEGLAKYNQINKVEPMQRALEEHQAQVWVAGLRRVQAKSREQLPVLALQGGRFKLLPIVDWDNRQVHQYLTEHQLSYHPLWEQGYVSIGDTHTSRPLQPGDLEEDTRFFGLKRECGLHFDI